MRPSAEDPLRGTPSQVVDGEGGGSTQRGGEREGEAGVSACSRQLPARARGETRARRAGAGSTCPFPSPVSGVRAQRERETVGQSMHLIFDPPQSHGKEICVTSSGLIDPKSGEFAHALYLR